jgi:hypothetical protein
LLLTSAGTAAAIAGQGALATLSSVGTTNIASNAATEVQTTETTASRVLTHDVWTELASHIVTTGGGKVQITCQIDIDTCNASGGFAPIPTVQLRVLRDGVPFKTRLIAMGNALRIPSPVFYASDSPASGTYDYSVEVLFKDFGDGSTRNCTISDEFFETCLIKR